MHRCSEGSNTTLPRKQCEVFSGASGGIRCIRPLKMLSLLEESSVEKSSPRGRKALTPLSGRQICDPRSLDLLLPQGLSPHRY